MKAHCHDRVRGANRGWRACRRSADVHLIVHDRGVLDPHRRAEGNLGLGPCNPGKDMQFSHTSNEGAVT